MALLEAILGAGLVLVVPVCVGGACWLARATESADLEDSDYMHLYSFPPAKEG